MSKNLFKSVVGLKNLGQAFRQCSTNSGGAPKKSWNENFRESYRRSTAEMKEFLEDDTAFYGVANTCFGVVFITAWWSNMLVHSFDKLRSFGGTGTFNRCSLHFADKGNNL